MCGCCCCNCCSREHHRHHGWHEECHERHSGEGNCRSERCGEEHHECEAAIKLDDLTDYITKIEQKLNEILEHLKEQKNK